MSTIENIKEQFYQLRTGINGSRLKLVEENAFNTFNKLGIPGNREEWKYTRIGSLFNKEYQFNPGMAATSLSLKDLEAVRLPGHEAANELVFINGLYSTSLSTIRSAEL